MRKVILLFSALLITAGMFSAPASAVVVARAITVARPAPVAMPVKAPSAAKASSSRPTTELDAQNNPVVLPVVFVTAPRYDEDKERKKK